MQRPEHDKYCYCWCKDTNFLANHNTVHTVVYVHLIVIAGAKILIF